MSTNYYVKHNGELLHIGKKSAGWYFSLHMIPELNLNSYPEWVEFLGGKDIQDEYNKQISLYELLTIISQHSPTLKRHPIDYKFCVGHEGYCDKLIGDYS